MAAINKRRVWLGTLAGGVVWTAWSVFVNAVLLAPRYAAAQNAGLLLKQPRYPLFLLYWIVTLFVLSYILMWMYVSVRDIFGPGPVTALRVGFLVGFVASFPINLSIATWAPFDRFFPLLWMLDLWVGAMLATFVAGWLYKD
jgi:hypothetical protein